MAQNILAYAKESHFQPPAGEALEEVKLGENAPTSDSSSDRAKEGTVLKIQELTNNVLHFLSNATNETLGACFVGLVAVTYLVLGRLGLILIGAIGGVIVHATWEENNLNHADEELRSAEARHKRERGFDIIERVLDWRERRQSSHSREDDHTSALDSTCFIANKLDFSDFPPATGAALRSLTDAVIHAHVQWWYTPLLPLEPTFPAICRQTFARFLLAISLHLSRKRPADTFLDFLTNTSSIVIVFLNELSAALMSPGLANSDPSKTIYKYLEVNPDSNLANVLDVEQQNKKLQAVAEDILQNFLDSKAYDCDPIKVFLREVLAGLILEKTVQTCSKAEWINGWIIYLLEEGETDLSTAIDVGVGGAAATMNNAFSAQSALINGSALDGEALSRLEGRSEHTRNFSRAESAMDEAMQEAKRLSELIAAEEAKKEYRLDGSVSSETTTLGNMTPTSSHSGIDGSFSNPPTKLDEDSVTASQNTSMACEPRSSFTNFDQIILPERSSGLHTDGARPRSLPIPMTLHNANISIFDDAQPGEKASTRSKPGAEYLLQIEPISSQHPGWMIARKYADFENLHEVLRRISIVSGVPRFAQKYGTLPSWKNRTKASLRSDLEHYLQDALAFDRLAESEGMKRFLEKDQGMGRSSPNMPKGGFGFPSSASFETVGKGMLDVLASAPKGAAGGGKAILGGVTGVLGGVGSLGQRKQAQASSSNVSKIEGASPKTPSKGLSRKSQEGPGTSFSISSEPPKLPSWSSRSSMSVSESRDMNASPIERNTLDNASNQFPFQDSNTIRPPASQATPNGEHELHLPPPPSEIPDDYNISQASLKSLSFIDESTTARSSTSTAPPSQPSPTRKSTSSSIQPPELPTALSSEPQREKPLPFSEKETRVAVELFFAVINELYTLSSAWNIRRTLLNAAKGFLLRPGNPNLEAIRLLLQDSIIEANTSDAGVAAHLLNLRKNTLPTEDERKSWLPPPSEEDKERLRAKARKLLVERGMPQALTSVMGAAASGEALGRVFDCLQVEEVARGLMFALVLQGVRAVTQ